MIVFHGLMLSTIASVFIFLTLRFTPRIWLQDYPPEVQALVPPKTESEKRLSLVLGIPFLLLLLAAPVISTLSFQSQQQGEVPFLSLALHSFGVMFIFNLIDWLVLDWLFFCTITPNFIVLPGSEDAEGYKNYKYHFRGFLIGIVFSAVAGLIIGAIIWLL
jgi:hypothetical protein